MARTVIVTGATGGIGRSVIERLAGGSTRLIALASRRDPLEMLAREFGCEPIAIDISDPNAIADALSSLEADVLVHVAGVLGPLQPIYQTEPHTVATLVSTNIIVTINLLRATVPGMKRRNAGTIILLGSICGNVPGAGPGVYSACKAALQSISANLRYELVDTAIRVSELRLGRIRTEIHQQPKTGGDLYDGYDCILPEQVADTILHILQGPPAVDLSVVEMMPTHQAVGGTHFTRT